MPDPFHIDQTPTGVRAGLGEFLQPDGRDAGAGAVSRRDQVVARGLRRQQLVSATNSGGSTLVTAENADRLWDMAREARGQGACDFVAEEIAAYLRSCGLSSARGTRLTSLSGGNHAFAFVTVTGPAGDERIVIDATWTQFFRELEIAPHIQDRVDRTLVGTPQELEAKLKGWSSNPDGEFLRKLIGIYSRGA